MAKIVHMYECVYTVNTKVTKSFAAAATFDAVIAIVEHFDTNTLVANLHSNKVCKSTATHKHLHVSKYVCMCSKRARMANANIDANKRKLKTIIIASKSVRVLVAAQTELK